MYPCVIVLRTMTQGYMKNLVTFDTIKYSITDALFESLAKENRRVVSDWRATILLRRFAKTHPVERRRWQNVPQNIGDIWPILARLKKTGSLKKIGNLPHLYLVIAPYARTEEVEEEEILMELHPFATISYHSAFAFHKLTNDLPKIIHAAVPSDKVMILPLGTTPEDWAEMPLVPGRKSDKIGTQELKLHKVKDVFGYQEYAPQGYPVRVTTPEKTLLDGLLRPEWCGGFDNVLRAWVGYKDLLDLRQIENYVELFAVAVLKQRVGFILEELGLLTDSAKQWANQAKRGSSSRLLGSAPFAPSFSEHWKLSINTPTTILHEL